MKLKLPNIYSFFSKTATLNKDNEITEYQFEHYKAENLCNLRQPGPVSPSVYDHQPKSSATEIIARLQAKLRDETEAKQVVIQNYKKLYQKYLNVLITLARVTKCLHAKKANSSIDKDGQTNLANMQSLPELTVMENHEKIDPQIFLSVESLKAIESISKEKRHDAAFVREILGRLYQNIEVLRSKSKKKMTPLKLNLIYYLFEKRINNSDASVEEKAHRTNQANINKLVNWAKHNLVRKSSVSKNM